jgi:hypothetical protein
VLINLFGHYRWREILMNGSRHIARVAVLSVLAYFTTVSAQAQVTASARPNPPPQICVNGQCETTPVTTTPPPPPPSGKIKWNPGHYMASYGTVYGGKDTSFMKWEMNDLNNQDAILGYRMSITWGALEPTQGNYDFSAIDSTLATLKTAYNKPKHLVILLFDYGMGALGQNDGQVIPTYIQQNPIYGPSPVGGSYGWWGKTANGASTGQYAPALYYQPVMDRFIAMVQALGQHLDADPNVEAIIIQEDATVTQSASELGTADPHYSDDAWLTQLKRLLSASTAAFPHTSVSMANSWMRAPADTVALEEWMASNRIAAGSADTVGQSAINTYGTGILSWGLQAHIGVGQYGGVDLRPKMAAMMDVEEPDMNGGYFASSGGPFAPLDVIHALNQTYYASHAFWTHLTGSPYPAAAQWPALAATCAANPLIHTSYPANYP